MIVHPAQPVARKPLDAKECELVLDSLMGTHGDERAELQAAGVPASAITALYPLDVEDFIRAVISEHERHGSGHLRADVVTQEQWHSGYDQVRAVADGLSAADRESFESAWYDYTGEKGLVYEFIARIDAGLQGWHPKVEAEGFASCYGRVMISLHWLTMHPAAAANVRQPQRILQNWVVNSLLPAETVNSLAASRSPDSSGQLDKHVGHCPRL